MTTNRLNMQDLAAGLNVEFHTEFLSESEANQIYQYFLKNHPIDAGRRRSQTFGDQGIVYKIHWYGKTTLRPTLPWTPTLLSIKSRLEALTNQVFNVCVVQCYPSGKIGIGPHRDKEMTAGTTIAGISVGQTRTLTLANTSRKHSLLLTPGSLYLLKPPTNNHWTHCIETDQSTGLRFSLTYRNYAP